MTFHLHRDTSSPDGIFGRLLDDSGALVAVTLEHAYGASGGGYEPKVPLGTYTCTRYLSPHRGYTVWMLNNVPGASFIEIHIGNYDRDSDGCILLGTAIAGTMIINSTAAFHKFMDLTKDESSLSLEIV